jgi:hypothetical protein
MRGFERLLGKFQTDSCSIGFDADPVQGSQCGSAQAQANVSLQAWNKDPFALQIRLQANIGLDVRVGHAVPHQTRLAAQLTNPRHNALLPN